MPSSSQCTQLISRPLNESARDNDNTAILVLSLDIILLFGDYLSLHDKFFLSHTCQALRNIMKRDWEWELMILSIPDEQRFWAGLAYVLPDHWACSECYHLHRYSPADLPYKNIHGRPSSCGVDRSRGEFAESSYRLQHHHVQLALKFSRLGREEYSKYLAALMKVHLFTVLPSTEPFTKSYTTEPRIISGRFFLREEWTIRNFKVPVANVINNNHFFIPVCPHLRIICGGVSFSRTCKIIFGKLSQRRRGITDLEDAIESALGSPGEWKLVSCPRCPVDCNISISKDLKYVKAIAWHDFGIEGSPLDGGWDVHVESKSYTDWLAPGPGLAYVDGGVRKLWSNGGESETRARKLLNFVAACSVGRN